MDISKNLKIFVKESGIPLKKIKEISGLSASDLMRWWVEDDSVFTSIHLKKIETFFGVDGNSIISHSYNKETIRSTFLVDKFSLPERYSSEEAFSYVRSCGHILKYLSLLYGQELVDNILLDMNIHPLYFENNDNKISLQFFIDILGHCHKLKFKDKDIRELASSLFLTIEGSYLESYFQRCNSYEEAYDCIRKTIHHFDNNFAYQFTITPFSVVIEATPYEATREILLKNKTDLIYKYRKEVFGVLPVLYGLPSIHMSASMSGPENNLKQTFIGTFPRLARHLSLSQF